MDRAGYVSQLLTGAVTQLSGWNFNSFAEVDGAVFGFNESGSYRLGGDLFGSDPIEAWFEIYHDFGQTVRLRALWIAYETAGNLALSYTFDDRTGWTDQVQAVLTSNRQHGAKVYCRPHQDKGQFLRLRVANTLGCDFSVDAISAHVIPLGSRREGV